MCLPYTSLLLPFLTRTRYLKPQDFLGGIIRGFSLRAPHIFGASLSLLHSLVSKLNLLSGNGYGREREGSPSDVS